MSTINNIKKFFKENLGLIVYIVFAIVACLWIFSMITKEDRQKIDTEFEVLQLNRSKLLADFRGSDENARINAFKSLRHDESLWPQLIKGLEENGSPALAAAFPGFSSKLTDAAVAWAERHGYKVVMYSRGVDVSYGVIPKDKTP